MKEIPEISDPTTTIDPPSLPPAHFDETAVASAQPVEPLPPPKPAPKPAWAVLAVAIVAIVFAGNLTLALLFKDSSNERRVEVTLHAPPLRPETPTLLPAAGVRAEKAVEKADVARTAVSVTAKRVSGRTSPRSQRIVVDVYEDDAKVAGTTRETSVENTGSAKPVARRVGVIYGRRSNH